MQKVLYLFGELTDEDVEWLMATGTRQMVPAGTTIIDEGKPAAALFIVLSGSLSVTIADLNDQEVTRLICGAVVGEMSFVDGRPPSATVRAREDSVVLAIPRPRLKAKLQRDPGFAARFYKALAMFLSVRLRGNVALMAGRRPNLDEDVFDEDQIEPEVLDHVFLAGARFDRMLKRLVEA